MNRRRSPVRYPVKRVSPAKRVSPRKQRRAVIRGEKISSLHSYAVLLTFKKGKGKDEIVYSNIFGTAEHKPVARDMAMKLVVQYTENKYMPLVEVAENLWKNFNYTEGGVSPFIIQVIPFRGSCIY